MTIKTLFFTLFFAASMILTPGQAMAEKVRVAVASNFTGAITSIAKRYEAKTGQKITLIFGSTGKHYAQIINGAPFDAFFAADVRRPKLLVQEHIALRSFDLNPVAFGLSGGLDPINKSYNTCYQDG